MRANGDSRIQRGIWAERKVCEYLLQQGLRLVESNYRSPFGEIDLVMKDADSLVFVEVRFRTSTRFVDPVETIDARKQRKLRATAEHYLQRRRGLASMPCRFDVAALTLEHDRPRIEWIQDAF